MDRSYSLKRHKEFRYTYARGRAQSAPLFTLVYAKSRSETVRVGFSVSKRVGNAVQRNRAKRRMRACVTPLLGHVSGGVNVIFVAKPEVLDAPFADLGRQAETLIRRAGLWRDEP
ncbi:MAG: ribonuclease P protein component [Clostridia bacterium]|nr:ribonuclease P protein component [Clostridia bacterium]